MGRRAAPKARGAELAIAVMMTLCADRTMGEGAKRGKVCSPATCEVLFGARRRARARGREARQCLQPGDVRSSLRRAAAGEGTEAHDLQPG